MIKLFFTVLTILSLINGQSEKVDAGEQSDLAKMLKASGSLLVKESHSLPPLKTTYGNDVKNSIFVLRNISTDEEAQIGLKLSIKEESFS